MSNKSAYGVGTCGIGFSDLLLRGERYRSQLRYETYKAAQIIHSEGDQIFRFGILAGGILKAENYTVNGVELCGCYFEPGDVFPEFLHFTGYRHYTYSLIAARRSTVAWISVSAFEKIIKEDPDMMYALLIYTSKRGLRNQLLLNCLNYQTIRGRIAYWLLGMNGLRMSSDGRVCLPRSQTIWANTLHVSRSSLNQELKRLVEEGCIQLEGNLLTILDREKLQALI